MLLPKRWRWAFCKSCACEFENITTPAKPTRARRRMTYVQPIN